jgi:hypothetical protein
MKKRVWSWRESTPAGNARALSLAGCRWSWLSADRAQGRYRRGHGGDRGAGGLGAEGTACPRGERTSSALIVVAEELEAVDRLRREVPGAAGYLCTPLGRRRYSPDPRRTAWQGKPTARARQLEVVRLRAVFSTSRPMSSSIPREKLCADPYGICADVSTGAVSRTARRATGCAGKLRPRSRAYRRSIDMLVARLRQGRAGCAGAVLIVTVPGWYKFGDSRVAVKVVAALRQWSSSQPRVMWRTRRSTQPSTGS